MIQYVDVVVNLPIDQILTYQLEGVLQEDSIGKRVLVEVNKKNQEAVIVGVHSNEPNYAVKKVVRVIDKEPVLTKEQIELAIYMKETYLSSLGEAFFKMIPSGRRNKSVVEPEWKVEANLFSLNEEQNRAHETIQKQFGSFACFLLYGITGSGKTEVYNHLIDHVLKNTDRSVLVLVPEISLTIHIVKKLEKLFGNEIAILHSALKVSDRFANYKQILSGKKRLAVGTRSAVFSPVKNLGLLIIDEEHDNSYKEHSNPRYHARQIAMERCKRNGATLVLGSATPAFETYFASEKGIIKRLELTKRAVSSSLAKVEIVKKDFQEKNISYVLQKKISETLSKKQQVILLLNRRGYNPFIYNPNSKEYIHCPNCSSNLCYHKDLKIKCHICGYKTTWNLLNAQYGKSLELLGQGTQKLEEMLAELFPDSKIERLDQDSTQNREVLPQVLARLWNREIDILTGTQMIAKGLDASDVTLVGVLNANAGLGVPDFRAGERVFSLLTQVAGRAGRGKDLGEVVIESIDPNHSVIQFAKLQNYKQFYLYEIKIREDLNLPPFSRLGRVVVRSEKEEDSQKDMEKIFSWLSENFQKEEIFLLGPSECPFYKMEKYYRNHILLKAKSIKPIRELLKKMKESISPSKKVYWEIDLDPIDLV